MTSGCKTDQDTAHGWTPAGYSPITSCLSLTPLNLKHMSSLHKTQIIVQNEKLPKISKNLWNCRAIFQVVDEKKKRARYKLIFSDTGKTTSVRKETTNKTKIDNPKIMLRLQCDYGGRGVFESVREKKNLWEKHRNKFSENGKRAIADALVNSLSSLATLSRKIYITVLNIAWTLMTRLL